MEVYLIRHTTPAIHPGICYGQSDVGLADSFCYELDMLRTRCPDIQDAVIYSSPLTRCRRLAEALGTPILDSRLMEMHFGDWELQAWEDIDRQDLDAWANDYVSRAPPNGETFKALYRRSIEFFDVVRARNEAKIAVVTHAGVIRSLFAYLQDVSVESVFDMKIGYGNVSKLVVDGENIQVIYPSR
ncbi:MAG: alpha-ribazole phosphatase [Acidiferrobacterales bacterium]